MRSLLLLALLCAPAFATPLVVADPVPAPVGVTTSPFCVWWKTDAIPVSTPGIAIDFPPVHAGVDPVYVATVPPTSGQECIGIVPPLPLP